ncbi:unnamed protein product [Cuscuta campestris]|uniref:RRM domain-containing protein n=1 Tax=Cuscuta campestris TaxID=132261 RepID=A0A484NG67_9ASTE|nr:unnamed protein product [Cuscuta campestris]
MSPRRRFADNLLPEVEGRVDLLETKSEANLIPDMETVEGLDETPQFVEGVDARKKTLIVDNLSSQAGISDIINFFEDVGKVVQVTRVVDHMGLDLGSGSVEFASANEAKKAQEIKNGDYLCGEKITLGLAKITPYPHTPRFCLEHKVWYEDYIRRESLPIGEEEIHPHSFKAIAARKKTIFVANLSPQTRMFNIIKFFKTVGAVSSVRLIVNHEGKHVGFCFVDFADDYDAKMALEEWNGEYLHDHSIFLEGAKTAPSSPRPKYSVAEKLWYEDNLLQKSLDESQEGNDKTPNDVEVVALREKTLFIDNLFWKTKISDIINFFKDVGEVVHVRLVEDTKGKHLGYGFVQFASADKAKAREKKSGDKLCGNYITLGVAEIAPDEPRPMYEDYLRGESLLIEEDEAVEGLDEFVEEAYVRNKTLFMDNLPVEANIGDFARFFEDVGKVSVRLIVDCEGEYVGCGFAKFASAVEAKMALKKKCRKRYRGRFIYLGMVGIAPYPLRPKYKLAELLWNEDFSQKERIRVEENNKKKHHCGKKVTFPESDDDS